VLAAVTFQDTILALHIAAAIAAFGVLFAYPVIYAVIARQDPRALAALHRASLAVTRRVVNPALLVLVAAGIYLASHEHQWSTFYVQWGFGIALLFGAIEGAYVIPTEKRLAELAERDVAAPSASGAGQGTVSTVAASAEYRDLARRVGLVSAGISLLILATVFMMANHVGA
jgi:hypothetical protein